MRLKLYDFNQLSIKKKAMIRRPLNILSSLIFTLDIPILDVISVAESTVFGVYPLLID